MLIWKELVEITTTTAINDYCDDGDGDGKKDDGKKGDEKKAPK